MQPLYYTLRYMLYYYSYTIHRREGEDCINISRKLVGKTHPEAAEPGSIRGDYCVGKGRNIVHASDSYEAAEREIDIWFRPEELITYTKSIESWVYAKQ